MGGLEIQFPSCVFLVNENKNKRWTPNEDDLQERAYGGYKKSHCFCILVFCDILGRFIHLEIADHGAELDRLLYTRSDVYRNRELYLSNAQNGMAVMGFAGEGELFAQYIKTENNSWLYKNEHKKDIYKQSMVIEW